mgnify:CR=1 FL=1
MLDINILLNDTELIKKKLKTRGFLLDIKLIEKLSKNRKEIITKKETLASKKNKLTESFKKANSTQEKNNLKDLSKQIEKEISNNKELLNKIENDLREYLLQIPNIPDTDVPVGKDETSNKVLKEWGKINDKTDEHSDILKKSGLLDFESAIQLSKSRFVVMKDQIAKLHRSLINFMLDIQIKEHGYTEYNVPYIANEQSLIGTGQLPKFGADLFKLENEKLYLIPTAEVPLTNLYANKNIDETSLPIKIVAHTPCFRSEAGSYGKDTKGMIRQHQFEKVEIVQFSKNKESENILEELTLHAEKILEMLNLPYRRICLSTGDLGFSSAKTYDLEVWMPGQKKYREISSCSNFRDFQSRRLKITYKNNNQKKFLHTLNGSGLAVGRSLAALIENNFDGSTIKIPEVLHSYTGFKDIKV